MRHEITFEGGPTLPTDVRKDGIIAIHRAPHKGYVLTHRETYQVVLWTRLKRDAVACRKALEAADWSNLDEIRRLVATLRDDHLP